MITTTLSCTIYFSDDAISARKAHMATRVSHVPVAVHTDGGVLYLSRELDRNGKHIRVDGVLVVDDLLRSNVEASQVSRIEIRTGHARASKAHAQLAIDALKDAGFAAVLRP